MARAGVVLLLALAAQPIHAGPLVSPGCLAGGAPAKVVSVDDALDLHLADGRIVHLPGVAIPDAAVEVRRDLDDWLTHGSVTVAPLRAEPDRWGRVVALVFAAPPADPERPVSVTEALVEAGRALARPDAALEPCWAVALRLEREAERQRRGLWATSPVLAAGDEASLAARAGSFTIVAGRIATVREGRARTYLRFAEDRGTGMAATLLRSMVQRLARGGADPRLWAGRRLRVRGLLDNRWGWQIEVTDPRQIELDPP